MARSLRRRSTSSAVSDALPVTLSAALASALQCGVVKVSPETTLAVVDLPNRCQWLRHANGPAAFSPWQGARLLPRRYTIPASKRSSSAFNEEPSTSFSEVAEPESRLEYHSSTEFLLNAMTVPAVPSSAVCPLRQCFIASPVHPSERFQVKPLLTYQSPHQNQLGILD